MLKSDKLFIVVLLAFFVVVFGVLAAYDHRMELQAEQIQAEWAAEQVQTERAAEQAEASAEASQAAILAAGQTVASHIADLKAMRSALSSTLNALKKKAKSSAAASRRWDRIWADRRARYASRLAAVAAHNNRERQRDAGGKVETANSAGELVIRDTYRPQYWEDPPRPEKPARLRVSVDSEIERLRKLRSQIDALASSVPPDSPAAQSFGPVYRVLAATAQDLEETVKNTRCRAGEAVVTKGAKGRVIDASRIPKVNQAALDAAFIELDRVFSEALTAVELSPEDVAAEGAHAQ